MKRCPQVVFVDERTRIDVADVADFAEMGGLDRYKYRKALADPALEAERMVIGEQAKARGVFGVPYFLISNRAFFRQRPAQPPAELLGDDSGGRRDAAWGREGAEASNRPAAMR
jgi:2-hydroxychromene-2-carboxylate isomerase